MTAAPSSRAPFRADIQGLRAVAVLLVVVYHARVFGLTGGYIGVDVFFVISGFLITGHLVAQLATERRINFGQFYARRARRILPASFAVLAATLVASVIFVPPTLRPGIMWDSIWTALYVPNMAFAIDDTNYLAETAPSPFQHYWSLGVEEQFYIFWPLVLLLIWLLARKLAHRVAALALMLVVVSFLAGLLLTYHSQPWAFFGLPTRAWELGVGALVAVVGPSIVSRIAPEVRSIGAWAGLATVLLAAIYFDELTAFPGWAALAPVLGTAAVIFFGQQATPYGPAAALSLRPMRFVGDISYSLYLVHWPLLVIPAAVGGTDVGLPPLVSVGLAVVGIPIAWLLYAFVENPVRRSRWLRAFKPRWTLAIAATISTLTVALALGFIGVASNAPVNAGKVTASSTTLAVHPNFTSFVPSNLRPALGAASKDNPVIYSDGCHLAFSDNGVQNCAFGQTASSVVVALFGDSHAAQWFPALETLANEQGFRLEVYTKSSCPSVDVTIYVNAVEYAGCDVWRDAVIAHLKASRPDLVVISNMANQPGQPGGGIAPRDWARGLSSVIERLNELPVAVLSDTPHFPGTPSICLSAHVNDTSACAQPRDRVIDHEWEALEADSARAVGATVIDLNDYLCDIDRCGMIVGATLIYRDEHHLTATFSTLLAEPLWSSIEPLLASKLE